MFTGKQKLTRFLLIMFAGIGLDQLTKILAFSNLKGAADISFLGDFFVLTYAENDGAFLSMGSGLPEFLRVALLIVLPLAVIGGIIWYLLRSKKIGSLEFWALSLVAAGGLGNMIDRIIYGSVVDFMNMGIGGLRTGIFNVADMLIMAALGLFIVMFIKGSTKKNKEEVPEESAN